VSLLLAVVLPFVVTGTALVVCRRWRRAGRQVDRLADPRPTADEIRRGYVPPQHRNAGRKPQDPLA
jgi:hypothetical protein